MGNLKRALYPTPLPLEEKGTHKGSVCWRRRGHTISPATCVCVCVLFGLAECGNGVHAFLFPPSLIYEVSSFALHPHSFTLIHTPLSSSPLQVWPDEALRSVAKQAVAKLSFGSTPPSSSASGSPPTAEKLHVDGDHGRSEPRGGAAVDPGSVCEQCMQFHRWGVRGGRG